MRKTFSLILFLVAGLLTGSAQTTRTFVLDASGQDAAIDDYYPAQNNPDEIEYNTCSWTISGTPINWRNLFRFDLRCIPPNATVTSVKLNLYYAANSFDRKVNGA